MSATSYGFGVCFSDLSLVGSHGVVYLQVIKVLRFSCNFSEIQFRRHPKVHHLTIGFRNGFETTDPKQLATWADVQWHFQGVSRLLGMRFTESQVLSRLLMSHSPEASEIVNVH